MRDQLLIYPDTAIKRSGWKVSFFTYRERALAEEASRVAKHNAEVLTRGNQNFKGQDPGYIQTNKDGTFTVIVV